MKLLTAYFVLSFYVLGALVIENDVNYATWYQIDADRFGAYHRALEGRLQLYLFAPMGIHLLLNGLIIWFRPATIPRWPFVVALLLNGYVVAESLWVQVPIHQALAERYSAQLVDELIRYHRLLRLPAELLVGGLNGWLLYRCLRTRSVTVP